MSLDHDAIRARADAATEGPWEARAESPSMDGGNWTFRREGKAGIIISMHVYQHGNENAEFIAHARTDIPALLDENARLRAALSTRDENIERAAKAAYEAQMEEGDTPWHGFGGSSYLDYFRDQARAVVAALKGADA